MLHHQLQSHAILKIKDLYPVQKINSGGDLPCCHFGLQKKKKPQPTHRGRLNSSKHTHKQEISLQSEGIFPSYNGVQRCVII